MALINCPECGKQISDVAIACPHCGYAVNQESNTIEVTQSDNTSIESKMLIHNFADKNRLLIIMNTHKKVSGIVLLCIALVFVIIIISKLTSDDYKSAVDNLSYYKSQYNECMSKSYGFLGSSYKSIADQWKDMIGDLKKTIWSARISSIILAIADALLIRFGIRFIKKAREEKNSGIDNLS